MELRPILSTLRRHKTASALIVLEIALSCAIICNALFLITGRLDRMQRPTGMAENELVRVLITGIGTDDNAGALTRSDLAVLRGLPGVQSASVTNQMVFDGSSWNSGVSLSPDQTHVTLSSTIYMGDAKLPETMGLKLVAGRFFNPDEMLEWSVVNEPGYDATVPVAIITSDMAEKLWPGQDPIGKTLYSWGDDGTRVVGVVDKLARPNDQGGPTAYYYSMILPIIPDYTVGGRYLLRVDPSRRAEVLEAAATALQRNGPRRIILEKDTLEDTRGEYYRQDRAMAWMLVIVSVLLLVVTALGIVGLASFWVQQRTKQIGVRRALGATRGQILRYFQTENFILATAGIVIGMLLAFGLNQLMMSKAELPRLPAIYLPVGALVLWLLGQVSVLGPARRAAAVPPAVATRSV
ncbi:MAG: ABC transporter permease [Pseudomonadota bacterium]|nr:ABC transporter permease [Pseudomonadota bacterium]